MLVAPLILNRKGFLPTALPNVGAKYVFTKTECLRNVNESQLLAY